MFLNQAFKGTIKTGRRLYNLKGEKQNEVRFCEDGRYKSLLDGIWTGVKRNGTFSVLTRKLSYLITMVTLWMDLNKYKV